MYLIDKYKLLPCSIISHRGVETVKRFIFCPIIRRHTIIRREFSFLIFVTSLFSLTFDDEIPYLLFEVENVLEV